MDFEMVDNSLPTSQELTLSTWLEALGLSELIGAFQEQGFDLPLIRAQALDEEDLAAIGVTKRGHIKKLLTAAQALKKPPQKAAPSFPASFPAMAAPASEQEISSLVGFCTKNMEITLDHQRACSYLDLALKLGEESLQSVCLDFIERDTLEVFSSDGFLATSVKAMELILQSPNLNIEEVVLFQALLRWKAAGQNRDLSPFVKYVRFGAMPPHDLLRLVEPMGLATPEQLLAAYRAHACPELRAAYNSLFFLSRKKVPGPLPSLADNATFSQKSSVFPVPSKGTPWKLTMSTKYSGLPNDYETLVNNQPNMPGAATNSGANQWIQATFEQPVIVQKVLVSAPSQGTFESQGWGGPSSAQSYLVGAEIQVSQDEKTWEPIGKVEKNDHVGFITTELKEPKVGKYFRLLRPNGYLATGSFILE